MHPFHSAAIVGVHNTKQSRNLAAEGWTSETITLDAVRGVMKDAGVTAKDIGAVMADGR